MTCSFILSFLFTIFHNDLLSKTTSKTPLFVILSVQLVFRILLYITTTFQTPLFFSFLIYIYIYTFLEHFFFCCSYYTIIIINIDFRVTPARVCCSYYDVGFYCVAFTDLRKLNSKNKIFNS